MRILSVVVVLYSFFLLGSCNVINPTEQVPTYVHIDSFQFTSTPGTGTSSHKILNVRVYFGNEPLGIYDLPANIPVLTDKPGQLTLVPGVAYSGLNNVLVTYPFYRSDTVSINPDPGKSVTVFPKTSYWGDSVLTFTNEDFESGNSFIGLEGDTLRRTSNPNYVFEGTYGGLVELKDSSVSTSVMSINFRGPVVSANKAEAYLELNYKGTLPFIIGLETNISGTVIQEFLYGFNPRSDWNKVYVGLQDFLSQYPNSTYRVLLRVLKQDNNPGYVAFDNFKVVTRK